MNKQYSDVRYFCNQLKPYRKRCNVSSLAEKDLTVGPNLTGQDMRVGDNVCRDHEISRVINYPRGHFYETGRFVEDTSTWNKSRTVCAEQNFRWTVEGDRDGYEITAVVRITAMIGDYRLKRTISDRFQRLTILFRD